MITFEYDNYIRELEQMAAPLATCITSERHRLRRGDDYSQSVQRPQDLCHR